MNVSITKKIQRSGKDPVTIRPSGSKNAMLPILVAACLCQTKSTIYNVPSITDTGNLIAALKLLGIGIEWNQEAQSVTITPGKIDATQLAHETFNEMRGTILLWSLLAQNNEKYTLHGRFAGCELGARPPTAHTDLFRDLGAHIWRTPESITIDVSGIEPKTVWLSETSPTATENAIILAVIMNGLTIIRNAASETHVTDLCRFLVRCGADIRGIESNYLTIYGGNKLHGCEHTLVNDVHEIATFMIVAATTGHPTRIEQALPEEFPHILRVLRQFNVKVWYEGNTAVINQQEPLMIKDTPEGRIIVRPTPWPGFPVDLAPLIVALAACCSEGQALVHNWMYEGGLYWVNELTRLGVNIYLGNPHAVMITAPRSLGKIHGGNMTSPNIIRAALGLVLVAMFATQNSTIKNDLAVVKNVGYIERGHQDIIKNLSRFGVKITEES